MSRLALSLAALLLLLPQPSTANGRSEPSAATGPAAASFQVEHTWWIKPGRSGQFIALFKKTRLPALQAEQAAGRLLGIRMSQPQLQGSREQWDFRLTLIWRDQASALAFSQTQRPADNHRQSMEAQLRDEMIADYNEVLVIEESL